MAREPVGFAPVEPRGINGIAQKDPARVALVAGDRRISFGELDADANRIARVLTDAGVRAGDRVAVMLHNRPELFAVWNGVARVGALVVPVSYRSLTDEVAYLVDDSGATALFYDDAEVVQPALPARAGLLAAWHADDDALWSRPATAPTDEYLGAPVVTMNYTSGTTGRPKGIERAAPAPTREYPPNPIVAFWGFTASDVHLLCGPAYHTAPGAYAQYSLGEGGTVVVMPRFTAESCLNLIQRERVTTSHMVPANFIRILEAPWHEFDLTSVKKILHAAAPCPPAVKRQIMEVFPPGTVWEYYGASEGMCSVISPEEWLRKPGSVGRAFPGVAITIRDEDGNELPPGEVGSVYASGMSGMPKFAYHNAPEKTSDAWRGDEFTVHDLGSLDEDGYLFLADRRVDLILRGGVNIYPAEVEHALATNPDVVDSAVFGLPDEQLGQHVHAILELRPGAAPDPDAILEHLRGQLAPYKLPTTFEFIDELPREPNGKVLKRQLRDARLGTSP
jgi:long-chain acyl-CoA synthetase